MNKKASVPFLLIIAGIAVLSVAGVIIITETNYNRNITSFVPVKTCTRISDEFMNKYSCCSFANESALDKNCQNLLHVYMAHSCGKFKDICP